MHSLSAAYHSYNCPMFTTWARGNTQSLTGLLWHLQSYDWTIDSVRSLARSQLLGYWLCLKHLNSVNIIFIVLIFISIIFILIGQVCLLYAYKEFDSGLVALNILTQQQHNDNLQKDLQEVSIIGMSIVHYIVNTVISDIAIIYKSECCIWTIRAFIPLSWSVFDRRCRRWSAFLSSPWGAQRCVSSQPSGPGPSEKRGPKGHIKDSTTQEELRGHFLS